MKLWPYYLGWFVLELILRTQYDNWFAWSVNASWTFCWFLLFCHSLKDKTAWFPPRAVVMVLAWEITLNIRYWTGTQSSVDYHNIHANIWPVITFLNLMMAWKHEPEKLAWPFPRRFLGLKAVSEFFLFLSAILFASYSLGADHTNNWLLDACLIPVLSLIFFIDLVRRPHPPKIPHLLRIFGEVIWMAFIWNILSKTGSHPVRIAVVATLLIDGAFLLILYFPGMKKSLIR